MKMVLEKFWRFASGDTEDAAFLWVKLHLPLSSPRMQDSQDLVGEKLHRFHWSWSYG